MKLFNFILYKGYIKPLESVNLKARLENQTKGGLFPDKDIAQLTINAYLNKKVSNKKLGVDLGDLSEIKNIISGIHSIYGIIYDIFDFNNLFTNIYKYKKNNNNSKQILILGTTLGMWFDFFDSI